MLVSIGVPTYNRPDTLERTLRHLINQSYKEIEIIISNNHSSNPGVEEVIQNYVKTDSRIRYYYQVTPLPPTKNFDFVKDKAQGEYYMWMADDDWIDLNYIETCVHYLQKYPEYVSVSGQCYYHQTEDIIINNNSSYSIEYNAYWKRMFSYCRQVSLNGSFYGLTKLSVLKGCAFPDKLAGDWLIVLYLCYKGKIKVLEDTRLHLSQGGASSDAATVATQFADKSFLKKNFVGLGVALNCAKSIFQLQEYKSIKYYSKLFLGVTIFLAAYSNTIEWDMILIKRKAVKFLRINSSGVVFPRK